MIHFLNLLFTIVYYFVLFLIFRELFLLLIIYRKHIHTFIRLLFIKSTIGVSITNKELLHVTNQIIVLTKKDGIYQR